ncbi:MAG: hypothetical protein AAFR64_01895 [Pseudomonadota bacterium]
MEAIEFFVETRSRALAETLEAEGKSVSTTGFEVGGASRSVGFIDGAYEIAAIAGVMSFPASVLAGMVANWIGASMSSQSAPVKAILTVRKNETDVEVEIEGASVEELSDLISRLLHDDSAF